MRFRIVHAADLHLDSPLVGLPRYEGAPVAELRGATRRALENLVQLCLEEDAKLLLLAGDLYDGDWKDYATGLFFAKQMARLREVGTQVVWIRGNHDAKSSITKQLALPEHCIELGVKQPETRTLEALQVAVHGQGFATPAVSEDLSERYPRPIAGVLNIGMLHTALGGRRGHANYAPCDLRALSARGYDYWALGHVHQREVVQAPRAGSREPWVVFPGNLQARHVREPGHKGATLITVEDGAITQVEHRELDVVRFQQLSVDVSSADDLGDVAELVRRSLAQARGLADGRLLCARVYVQGRSAAHRELARDRKRAESELKRVASELEQVWLEGARFDTEAAHSLEQLAQRDDAAGQLVRALGGERDDATLAPLVGELKRIEASLPHELNLAALDLDLDEPGAASAFVRDVSRQLLSRLLGEP